MLLPKHKTTPLGYALSPCVSLGLFFLIFFLAPTISIYNGFGILHTLHCTARSLGFTLTGYNVLNNGNIFNFVTIGALRTKYHSLGNFQFLVFEVLHAPRGKLHFLGGCTTWIGNNRLWPAERSLSFFVGLWTPPGCGLLSLDPIGRDNYERLSRQGINYPVSAVRSRLLVVLLSCLSESSQPNVSHEH